jgi:hypothetical protein
MRQAVTRATKAKNKLNYLKSFVKMLNGECRGVADAIEGFFLQEFLRIAKFGCVDSNVSAQTMFGVAKITDLIELSDKETGDAIAQEWQKAPGFSDRLIDIVTETIRNIVMNCTILDPSKPSDIGKIIRSYAGITMTTEGDVLDIVGELNDKREAYCAASMEDKRNLFGIAGKIVASTSILVIPDQHLTVTTLVPDASLGLKDGNYVALMRTNFIGGKDENGVANNCSSTFEYMMMNLSLADGKFTKLIVNFTNNLSGCYDCILTTDGWFRLSPSTFNE